MLYPTYENGKCLGCACLGASSWVWADAASGISRFAVLGALPAASGPPKLRSLSQGESKGSLARTSS
jgi:hypothetical protein